MAMDMVQPTQGMDVDSGDQTKTIEKDTVTEASQEIRGTGFGFRDRKKSKYLSYPYTTIRPRDEDSEEKKTPNGSASGAKLGSKRFGTNWHRKFISPIRMSSSPEFINASSKELLSELHSKAADCMFPTENKSFELVEWFVSRYRISTYHDEAELATSLVDEKGGKTGKCVGSNLLDNKNGTKRKNNKMDNEVRRKTKSFCGLSDNGQSKEELVLTGSNTELCVSNEGLAGNSANLSLVESNASEVGTVFQEGPIGNISDNNFYVNAASEGGTISQEGLVGNINNQLKSRVGKPAEEHHHTKNVTDLNGICSEFDLIRKEVETVNVLTPGFRSGPSRSLSGCSRPFNNDRVVETNGKSGTGTVLLLQFAPGAYIPSKDKLLTIFSQFGPLKAYESLLFEGTGIAQIIFVRSTDAGEAFHSLEKKKPFGTTLIDYKLYHLPAACPSVKPLVTPTQPARPVPKPMSAPLPLPVSMSMSKLVPVHEPVPVPVIVSTPMPVAAPVTVSTPVPVPMLVPMALPLPGQGPPPSLEFIKQNLEMMASTLENSGNNLSPHMKAKLDTEIKNLLRKVNSRAKSDP